MRAFNSLKFRITNENWFGHLLAFLGTILGILIALELDKRKEVQNEQAKLKGFLTLVDNELLMNQNRLGYANKGHVLNLMVINLAHTKERSNGMFKCSLREVDSLVTLHPELAEYIHLEKKIDNDFALYTSNLNLQDDPEISLDAWDMIKTSGLMSELNPLIAFQYAEMYKSLRATNELYTAKQLIGKLEQAVADDKLSETEIVEINDRIETMKILNEIKINNIKQGIARIKELKQDKDNWVLSVDPADSLMVKWNKTIE